MSERVLLAADGGSTIGLGHLSRVLAMAAALEAEGAWAGVAAPVAGPFRARVDAHASTAVPIDGWPAWDGSALDRLLDAARAVRASTLVLDTYRVESTALEWLRAAGLTLVAFDDLAAGPSLCHLVIDPAPAAAEVPRRSRYGDTRFLLGPLYAPLRREFWTRARRSPRASVERIVLTLGGGDVPGLHEPLLHALEEAPGEFAVDAVIGPFADVAPLVAVGARCHRRLHIHRDPPDLPRLLLEADIAISAAGQTLFELAWAGCPAVAIAVADNQRANLRGFVARGTVRAAPVPAAVDFEVRLGETLHELLGDAAVRREMGAAGQRLVDGDGARRVAAASLAREPAA